MLAPVIRGGQLVSARRSTCPLPWVKGCASLTKSTPSVSWRHSETGRGLAHRFEGKGRLGRPVSAPMLAAEWDGLPLGLGPSFISKRRQMVGLALAPSSQSPKVHFCDGCGEWEHCREDWGTSARADNGGQSMSGLSSRRLAFTNYSFPPWPLEESFWVYLLLTFIALLFAALISEVDFQVWYWLEKSLQTWDDSRHNITQSVIFKLFKYSVFTRTLQEEAITFLTFCVII